MNIPDSFNCDLSMSSNSIGRTSNSVSTSDKGSSKVSHRNNFSDAELEEARSSLIKKGIDNSESSFKDNQSQSSSEATIRFAGTPNFKESIIESLLEAKFIDDAPVIWDMKSRPRSVQVWEYLFPAPLLK